MILTIFVILFATCIPVSKTSNRFDWPAPLPHSRAQPLPIFGPLFAAWASPTAPPPQPTSLEDPDFPRCWLFLLMTKGGEILWSYLWGVYLWGVFMFMYLDISLIFVDIFICAWYVFCGHLYLCLVCISWTCGHVFYLVFEVSMNLVPCMDILFMLWQLSLLSLCGICGWLCTISCSIFVPIIYHVFWRLEVFLDRWR